MLFFFKVGGLNLSGLLLAFFNLLNSLLRAFTDQATPPQQREQDSNLHTRALQCKMSCCQNSKLIEQIRWLDSFMSYPALLAWLQHTFLIWFAVPNLNFTDCISFHQLMLAILIVYYIYDLYVCQLFFYVIFREIIQYSVSVNSIFVVGSLLIRESTVSRISKA